MPTILARQRPWRLTLALLLALPLLGGLGWRAPGDARAATALPTHVGLGLSAQPSQQELYGWLPQSGIPWDYAYQYLAAGVNTGNGWETWNERAQFPLWYAQGARDRGYIPVFTYYDLLQSNGNCNGCGETQRDLANLNNAATMAAYYRNFALLMQRLGTGTHDGIAGFGDTAIVHIEPDLSGYAQQATLGTGDCHGFCTGVGNDPALLRAAVASSGVAEVAGYPDTYQGFNWALLHLRDLYAPNVRLAIHVSGWSTGIDIGGDRRADLDAAALGTTAGEFAARSGATVVPGGVSTYDLVFNDVADRDAGQYKYGGFGRDAFVDRQNATFPNFRRWEGYLGAAIAAAGRKPAYVWQIPLGNQVFATMNNTDGHYQDNRAEYFLGHIPELAGIGIVGLLFGAGNDGGTRYTDAEGDGITNPASFCTSDGTSGPPICNTRQSTVADDDGGFIREAGRQYYAAPYPLPGASPSPSPSSSASPSPSPSSSASPSPSPSPGPAPTGRFADVPADYWAHDQIERFAARNITMGCDPGRYCPERGVTRAEMAVFLERVAGDTTPATPAAQRFADVPPDYWAYAFVEPFAARGITTGCAVGEYCPDRGVSRAEMAAFLIRALGGAQNTEPQIFADVPPNHPQYGYIQALYRANVTTGCGTDDRGRRFYCPDRGVTRAEMAVFIIRAFP